MFKILFTNIHVTLETVSGDFNTHHNLHKDELKCDVCQRSFYKKSALNTHIASVHNKEKKFFCQQPKCSKGKENKFYLGIGSDR